MSHFVSRESQTASGEAVADEIGEGYAAGPFDKGAES